MKKRKEELKKFESLTKYPEYFHEAYYVGICALWFFAYGIAWQLKKISVAYSSIDQELKSLKPYSVFYI